MRTKREISNTGIYHVMARGNGKQEIFIDEVDNRYFLKLIIEAKEMFDAEIYAYCIMGNHYHLLVKCSFISDLCKKINQKYAHYYNAKRKTVGHVFQSRYKSFPVEDGDYLICVLRYIHNNPVKAGMTNSPGKYVWSSYKDYLSGQGLTTTGPILELFDKNLKNARRRFVEFSEGDDGFDYETHSSHKHFRDYRKGIDFYSKWPTKNTKPGNRELRKICDEIQSRFSLTNKEIISIIGISSSRYYKEIAKKE